MGDRHPKLGFRAMKNDDKVTHGALGLTEVELRPGGDF